MSDIRRGPMTTRRAGPARCGDRSQSSSRRTRRHAGRRLRRRAARPRRAAAARGRSRHGRLAALCSSSVEVAATAEQAQNLVPNVRVAAVGASGGTMNVTLPATTTAFEAANIFARASGYIEKRYVDIGDHVKAGDLLAEITAPELDHQIAQAQATLAQNQATLQQTKANRELADVTNGRDSTLVKQGWVTQQQGDTDRLNLQAQQAAVGVAQSNIAAQEAQLEVLQAAEGLSAGRRAVRRRDHAAQHRHGSLVQADATSGTFMFTLMQTDVIRTQVYRAAGRGLRS